MPYLRELGYCMSSAAVLVVGLASALLLIAEIVRRRK